MESMEIEMDSDGGVDIPAMAADADVACSNSHLPATSSSSISSSSAAVDSLSWFVIYYCHLF